MSAVSHLPYRHAQSTVKKYCFKKVCLVAKKVLSDQRNNILKSSGEKFIKGVCLSSRKSE